MSKTLIVGLSILVLGGVLFALPSATLAQLDLPSPTIPGGVKGHLGQGGVDNALTNVFNQVARVLMVVAIGLFVVVVVIGAIMYITAGGNEDRTKSARQFLINGIIGAVILFALAWILSIVISFTVDTFDI